MEKIIQKINSLMPPLFHIEVKGNDIELYIADDGKMGNDTPKLKYIKTIYTGTKMNREIFLKGMEGTIDLFLSFDELLKDIEEEESDN